MFTLEAPQTTVPESKTPNVVRATDKANVQINIQFSPVELFIDKQNFYTTTNGEPIELKDYPKYIEDKGILYKINISTDNPEPTFKLTPNKVFIGDKGYAQVEYDGIENNEEIEGKVRDFILQYFKIAQTI